MEKLICKYINEGYNCSQCLLKAAAEKYDLDIPDNFLSGFNAINDGFGIGGICSALVAGFVVFGLMFDEEAAKVKRLMLLSRFHSAAGSFDCCELSGGSNDNGCICIVMLAARLTDEIIAEAREDLPCCCFRNRH